MRQARIVQGSAIEVLRTLPDDSVHCCVTSPPYWGLRDYGVAGQLGLEPTPEEYVARMVEIFREVRRVIRGTAWVNLGDCYSNDTKWGGKSGGKNYTSAAGGYQGQRVRRGKDCDPKRGAAAPGQPIGRVTSPDLKPKDLVGMPWRIAFALQADGWYLRSDIIWHKPNPMPESVTDRPTKAHEYIFLLAKSEKYYYDADAIKEPAICGDPRKPYAPGQVDNRGDGHARGGGKIRPSFLRGVFNGKTEAMAPEGRNSFRAIEDWRNRRSVWTVPTQPFPEAHFATFPEELIRPCVLAGCPEGGTVIDPFCGSGTTGVVALGLGREFIGIELNPAYCEMARRRIESDQPLFNSALLASEAPA